MRKKVTTNTKNIKIKRTKLKRVSKAKPGPTGRDSKAVNQPLIIERRGTGSMGGWARLMLRNSNQPKKSHSLDSMQIYAPNHSIVSPTYAPATSADFNANPAAFYAIQRGNID